MIKSIKLVNVNDEKLLNFRLEMIVEKYLMIQQFYISLNPLYKGYREQAKYLLLFKHPLIHFQNL